jgi:hypothetical protein
MSPSLEVPDFYCGRESDLVQELLVYYQQSAGMISDLFKLEQILVDLCKSDESQITKQQAELRQRQIRFVKNVRRERDRVDALQELYESAMDEAYAVGSDYYRETAGMLTDLQAEAHDVLEDKRYHEFNSIVAKIKGIADHAARLTDDSPPSSPSR